jgi:ABC-type sugar transport system substrate-binding protein
MAGAAGLLPGFPALASQNRLRVALACPGRQADPFWQMAGSVMQAAARDLDIDLTIAWGERDRSRIIALGLALVDDQPDYMLVTNDYRTAVPIIQAAQRRNIPSLIAFSDLMEEDVGMLNNGEGIRHLIGSLVPDNARAGRIMGRSLVQAIRQAGTPPNGRVPLIAIGGARSTQAALHRLQGLYDVLRADPSIDLLDEVSVNWSRDEAYQRALALLRRQPQVAGVWCANDDLALGAMQAAGDLGRRPGEDIFFVGLNWQPEALDAVADGRMRLSLGGHFLVGAWALAMLRDHYDSGQAHVACVREVVKLAVMDKERVGFYRQHFSGDAWERLDYRRFRQGDAPHGFAVEPLLAQLPPAKSVADRG